MAATVQTDCSVDRAPTSSLEEAVPTHSSGTMNLSSPQALTGSLISTWTAVMFCYCARGIDAIANFESFVAASVDTQDGVFVSADDSGNGFIIENVKLAELTENDVAFA
jgi:hypothetical protein